MINTRNIPLSAWLLGIPGTLCLLSGAVLLAGDFHTLHPLLADAGAGIVLIVSGIALLGSAGFPLVLSRLAAGDEAPKNTDT